MMGVVIDTLGLFGASQQPFTFFKAVGIVLLLIGILLMNQIPKDKLLHQSHSNLYIWLIIGFIFGCAPIQTTINSALAKEVHSSFFCFISVVYDRYNRFTHFDINLP